MNSIPSTLFKQWTHSHEEDREGELVYRPSEYSFPRSRGRRMIDIRQDGTFTLYDIAPTDGLYTRPGVWESVGVNTIRLSFDEQNRRPQKITILSCDDNLLHIRLN